MHEPIVAKNRPAGVPVVYGDFSSPSYFPARIPSAAGVPVNVAHYAENNAFRLKTQPFEAGGFELCVQLVNIQAAAMHDPTRQAGKRECPEERSERSIETSIARSKRMIRKHACNIGACRMITLGRRGLFATRGDAWDAWAIFHRLMISYSESMKQPAFGFICVPEKEGNGWHLHVLTNARQKMNVNLLRHLWYRALGGRVGGDTPGSVNVGPLYPTPVRGARYIAKAIKYISKDIEGSDFNKRRFASSGSLLLAPSAEWLPCKNIAEVLAFMQYRYHDFKLTGSNFFLFPNDLGFWAYVLPVPSPPPF